MPNKTLKILVVEDEPSLIFTLRDTLESEGYDVIVSEDGEQAVGGRARPPVALIAPS